MVRWNLRSLLCRVLLLGLLLFAGGVPAIADEGAPNSVYEFRIDHHPDGIGKFYMGREIAEVMGHRGAGWLERPTRSVEEQPQKAIDALPLKSTDVVADIGAGTGYFTFRMAPKVAKVYAVDVQPEMIEILQTIQKERSISNVEPVLGTETNPHLPPNSLDWAILVDAYHEFAYPREIMMALQTALKPGGRVVLLEYKGENPLVPIKKLHKMTQTQVRAELSAIGYRFIENKRILPQQHLLIFQKPTSPKPAA